MAAIGILEDPTWFPIGFDLNANTLTLLKTSRELLSRSAFLDQRFFPAEPQVQTLDLNAALQSPPTSQPINWVFHTAFCCSTLMARALDRPGQSLSLKEPDILMQLANARRMAGQHGTPAIKLAALESLVLALLGRRFEPGEAIVIKPTNPANPLIDLAIARSEPCLFMVSPLEDFLISVIKKGEACRSFIRTLFNIFTLDPYGVSQIPQRQALTFTDLQITALVWIHQVQFMSGAAQRSSAMLRAMDGTKLPANPEPYLKAASDHFGLGWKSDDAKSQAESEIFARNSKFDDQSYDASIRRSEASAIKETYAESIDLTLRWAKSVNLGGNVQMLPAPALVEGA